MKIEKLLLILRSILNKTNMRGMNISQEQKNALAVQYEPLVNKITKQFVEKVKVSWDDVKSMA